jgi:hypothetical protein
MGTRRRQPASLGNGVNDVSRRPHRSRECLYELLELGEVPRIAGHLRQAGPRDRSLMILWTRAFQDEIGGVCKRHRASRRADVGRWTDLAVGSKLRLVQRFVQTAAQPLCVGPSENFKMSMETILIIVVVVFLLGGGGWYWGRGRG